MMPNANGKTEVVVKLSDGTTYTVTADASAGLQAVFLDPAAAIAAGVPMGSGTQAGVTVTKKQAVQVGGATMAKADTTTGVCYMLNGVLYCYQ